MFVQVLQLRSTSRPKRRGIALVMVLFVLALTAVLGAAMLSSSSLQSDVSATTLKSAEADALAESGVQIAEYYLAHPADRPVGWPSFSFTPTQLPKGSVAVSVSGTNPYVITSTARDSTDATGAISRAISSTVNVNSQYDINAALTSNSSLLLTTKVALTINSVALADVICTGTVSGGTTFSIDANASSGGPTAANVNTYQTYTLPNGQTGTAQTITGNLTISSAASLPTALATNPGDVFYVTGNIVFSLTAATTFTGTLVSTGNVVLNSNSKTPTINPVSGLPAIVALGKFTAVSGATGITANGVVFIATGMGTTGGNTTMTFLINGALLIDTGGITSTFVGHLTVNYNLSSAGAVPALSTASQTPVSVTVTQWSD